MTYIASESWALANKKSKRNRDEMADSKKLINVIEWGSPGDAVTRAEKC